jgi:hypothetical protein
MMTHMQRNHNPDPNFTNVHGCEICDFKSSDKTTLSDHIVKNHMKSKLEVSLPKLQQFKCQKCNFAATHQTTLSEHVTNHHTDSSIQPISFECELCPFTASLHINLRKHIAVTHAKIGCDKCQFTTSSEFHLSLHKEHQHKDTQHQKQPLFPCDLCGITFVHQDDLDNHILRRHGPRQDETSPPGNIPNHVLTLVLEEQIDMAQSLKELKDTFNAHLAEIRSDQESFRDIMKQLVNGNILLSSSFKQFEKAQSNIDKQVQSISTAIFSFSPSPPAITPAVSSNAGRSESTFPPR